MHSTFHISSLFLIVTSRSIGTEGIFPFLAPDRDIMIYQNTENPGTSSRSHTT